MQSVSHQSVSLLFLICSMRAFFYGIAFV